MKRIGLLGGMTSESSLEYYRLINRETRNRLGGIHSAESVMVSVDFAPIQTLMEAEAWGAVLHRLIQGGQQLEAAGAECLVLCTNTLHKLADELVATLKIPLISIIDATAQVVVQAGVGRVGLLGTRFTMTEPFYRERLKTKYGIDTIVPEAIEMAFVHRVITEELTVGRIVPESKAGFWHIIEGLRSRGADGVILGCTEIPLLVKPDEGETPLFDTTAIHAQAAVSWALG